MGIAIACVCVCVVHDSFGVRPHVQVHGIHLVRVTVYKNMARGTSLFLSISLFGFAISRFNNSQSYYNGMTSTYYGCAVWRQAV